MLTSMVEGARCEEAVEGEDWSLSVQQGVRRLANDRQRVPAGHLT
jgi:hypothetical protein